MMKTLAERIAELVQARANCLAREPVNQEWAERHEERALDLVSRHLPSGSGFDAGTALDLDKSTGEKLVFTTSFHHMNEGGMYDGWTQHTITVRPSLLFGFVLTVGGRDRNDIKNYIGETFHEALARRFVESPAPEA